MNNKYLLDMPYIEEVVTLTDFDYGTLVKCKVPSLCVRGPIIKEKYQIHDISTSNIQNKGSNLSIDKCRITNYLDVYIPSMYAYPGPGKPGMRFLVTFSGGDISKFTVCGRCY